ncbi:MAG: BatA domain-containing protein [Verrucomicrobiales bacterium]
MSFLFPWFLAGLVGLVAPILFHFRQKQTKDVTKFSSLMFLETAPVKQRTQSQIQHWLLLITRCLIIALIALAFTRPFFRSAIAALSGEPPEKVVVLLDRSASMKRTGLWEEAVARVTEIVGSLKPSDLVQISAYDSSVTPVFSFADSKETGNGRDDKIQELLKDLEPTWESTDLGRALVHAAEAIEQGENTEGEPDSELSEGEGRVVVVSDAQEGSDIDQLKAFLWPEKIELEFENLTAKGVTNASIQLLPEARGLSHVKQQSSRYFRVENSLKSGTDMFTVRWRNADLTSASEALTIKVPPGETEVLKAPGTTTGVPAPILELAGDDHDFDNRAYTEAIAAQQLRVLYVGSEPDNDPQTALFFLRRALFPTRTLTPELTKKLPDDTFEPDVVRLFDLIVIASDGPLANAGVFRDYVENGGRVLFLMHAPEAAAALGDLLGIEGLTATAGNVTDYRLLGAINRRHPLLAAFADARYGDFSNVHFWQYRKLDDSKIPDAGVLSRFDNGDPAWILTPKGQGTVLTFTSSWKRADSQLALSTKFIPLLYAVLSNQAAATDTGTFVHVGEPFPVNIPPSEEGEAQPPAGSVVGTVTAPDDSITSVTADDAGVFRNTTMPGLYSVTVGDQTSVVAVNLDPNESEIDPLDTEIIRKMVEPKIVVEEATADTTPSTATTAEERAEQRSRAKDLAKEKQQRLWRYLLFAVLALVIFEIWYSAHCRNKELKPQDSEAQ